MDILEQVKKLFKKENFIEVELPSGDVIKYDELTEGNEIYILVDDQTLPLPDGEYEIEGKKCKVAGGLLTEVEEITDTTEESETATLSLHEETEQRFQSLETKLVQMEEALAIILTALENKVSEDFTTQINDLKTFLTEEISKIEIDQINSISIKNNTQLKQNHKLSFGDKLDMFLS